MSEPKRPLGGRELQAVNERGGHTHISRCSPALSPPSVT